MKQKVKLYRLNFWAWCIGVTLLMGYLWIWRLEGYYLTHDHAWHLLMSHKLSWNLLDHVRWDSHPPLYYLFLKGAMMIFGVDSILILRGVSLFLGCCTAIAFFF